MFDPRFQAADATGKPYSGAQLFFYRGGTTSLIPIYKNSDATTPHANPVVANTSGAFPAIFIASANPFKIILKSAAGVTLDTIDRIPVGEVIDLETLGQIVHQAEESAVASAASAEEAAGYAAGLNMPAIFPGDAGKQLVVADDEEGYQLRAAPLGGIPSRAWAIANLHPAAAPDSLRTDGYASAGDGGGALYKKVASEPARAGKFAITLADAVTVVWYEIAEKHITPLMFGAVGDGVTGDSAAIEGSFAAMQVGMIWNGQGRTYSVTSQDINLPANVNLLNTVFKLDGSNDQLMFDVKGTRAALTYGGGAIAAGATQLTSLSGLTSADVGKALHISSTSDHIGQTNYKRGELAFIKGVSGTTITLSHQVQLAYTANIVVELVSMKPGVSFRNVKFISTKGSANLQGGVKFDACSDAECEIYGENLGYFTVQRRLCYNHHVSGGGSNEVFATDNGFDYFLVDAGGCLLSADVKGRGYRHVYVCGWEASTQFGTRVKVIGHACKDSACDAHPNVMDFQCDVQTFGIRQGGTFSNQPVGLMYQGGGILRARVDVDGYDTSAVVVQLLQSTDDQVEIAVQGRKPSAAAARGVDFQVQKPGGKVLVIDASFNGEEMSNAASRGISVDTVGSATGLVIESIVLGGSTPGKEAGKQVTGRTNHNIRSVIFSGLSFGQAAGGYGTYAVAEVAAGIGRALVNGHTTNGIAGSFGNRCSNVAVSLAAGTLTTGVGGASLTTNALIGFSKADAAANHYT